MCTTIDGKILGDRWGKLPGTPDNANLFETTAASFGIGAWLVGTTTMQEFSGRNVKLKHTREPVPAGDFVANPRAKSLAIGADAKAVLRFQENEVDGDHVVLLVTDLAGDDYRAHLRAVGVSYLVCGKSEINLPIALDKIAKSFRLKKLMLQGGGKFNGAMLKAGLVDEISQVIVPVVDGGVGISGFFDIPGDPPAMAAATLRNISHRKLPGGVNWFRYRVIGKPTKLSK
jgi:riboflavin biosynthesis pyrimidine reductase